MSLLWSGATILFLLIPLAIVAYIILLRRRRRFAVRYSSLLLVRDAISPRQSWLRRHLSFALFLLAIASLIMAFTRPVATVTIPSNKSTIILTLDVSRSMCSTDISPNRLEAAKDAAQFFIKNHKSGRQIGIVAFAGFAELIQPPTTDESALDSAVESLTTARRTAIGSAILRAIDAIAEVDDRVAPSDNVTASSATGGLTPSEVELFPHIIVLLTDGASNAGPYPLTAAQQAVARGIRIYTIGYGTPNNTSPMNCGELFQGQDQFGQQGFGFGAQTGSLDFRRQIDEETLKQIADMTGGTYYAATSAAELEDVFQNLPTYLVAKRETIEVSVFFNIIAALAIIVAMVLSFLWNPLS